MLRFRRSRRVASKTSSTSTRKEPERQSIPIRKVERVGSWTYSRPASGCSLRSVGFADLPGAMMAMTTPDCSNDVVEVCRIAKSMQVPVSEVQRPYSLFRDHVGPLADGKKLLKDGRLSEAQFTVLLRENFPAGSEIELNRTMLRAFRMADADKDGALSFEEFVSCLRCLTFDEALNVSMEERDLRGLAKEYNLSVLEVDKYKRIFDELDVNGSGGITSCEFEDLLYRCGNIPRGIGLSSARMRSLWRAADAQHMGCISFEDFLAFNLRYFAEGARGLHEYYPQ